MRWTTSKEYLSEGENMTTIPSLTFVILMLAVAIGFTCLGALLVYVFRVNPLSSIVFNLEYDLAVLQGGRDRRTQAQLLQQHRAKTNGFI
jgi:hypothetical protein